MRGTGRYNLSQGMVATMQGIGAALSNTVAGVIVVQAGYSAAFLMLAGVAVVACVVFLVAMPETAITPREWLRARPGCAWSRAIYGPRA